MATTRKMSYNGVMIAVEDTTTTAKLLIDGKEVDSLGPGARKLELSGILPTGELVKVQIYGVFVGKFRLIIGDRVIAENWC